MKYINYVIIICVSIVFTACPSDDDNMGTIDPPIGVNQFTSGSTVYVIDSAYRSNSTQDAPGLYVTNVVFTTSGLTLNATTQQLEGAGDLVAFEFYTTTNNGLQSGTYNLDSSSNQPNTVYGYVGFGYDATTGSAMIDDDIFQGTITVTNDGNGMYTITRRNTTQG